MKSCSTFLSTPPICTYFFPTANFDSLRKLSSRQDCLDGNSVPAYTNWANGALILLKYDCNLLIIIYITWLCSLFGCIRLSLSATTLQRSVDQLILTQWCNNSKLWRHAHFVLLSHAFSSYGISQHSPAMADASQQHTMQCDPLNILQTLITTAFNTVYG